MDELITVNRATQLANPELESITQTIIRDAQNITAEEKRRIIPVN